LPCTLVCGGASPRISFDMPRRQVAREGVALNVI
jgi:hypothetical protein